MSTENSTDAASRGLFGRIKKELRDPSYKPWRVGLSMCASWSMGVSMAAGLSLLSIWGLAPFIVWMTFNALAIPIFSVMYTKFPQFREFINFRIGLAIMFLVAFLQITLNQNAMRAALAGGVDFASYSFMGTSTAMFVTMGLSTVLFVFIYFYGLPGSITTDVVQYFGQVAGALAIIATGLYFGFGGVEVPMGVDPAKWLVSATIGIGLGPQTDPTQWQRIEKAPSLETGIWGGAFMGFYLLLVLGAALTFGGGSLLHGTLFAIVVFSVATSTLDSIAAAMHRLLGGRKRGLVAGLIGVGVFPMAGVIGVGQLWSIFATYRAPIIITIFGIAVIFEVVNRYVDSDITVNILKTHFDIASDRFDSVDEHIIGSDD